MREELLAGDTARDDPQKGAPLSTARHEPPLYKERYRTLRRVAGVPGGACRCISHLGGEVGQPPCSGSPIFSTVNRQAVLFAVRVRVAAIMVAKTLLVFCALSCAAGCSGSMLIGNQDPTFARAQARLERTASAMDEARPSAGERALFVQAESFYRYRFDPPPRGAAATLAAAAAAVTDFPAFQSLAGSLDLLDLRLRAPDAAVQLWETLLARYPQSSLRPLTL